MAAVAPAPVLRVFEIAGLAPLLASHGGLLARSGIADPEAFLTSDEGRAVRVIVTPGPIPLEEWMWRLPGLGRIACMGVGYDGIDLGRARSQGIAVTAGGGVNREDVADLAIGLMIAVVRQIVPGDRLVRSGKWDRLPAFALARPITRMRCGIVGLGAIGTAVARRLTGFGAAIAWWGPNPKADAKWSRAQSLEALARDSDVLILAAPSTAPSCGRWDRTAISSMFLAAISSTRAHCKWRLRRDASQVRRSTCMGTSRTTAGAGGS
jgi:lactate dehydrogenase-like 2-hydroxyacid dehydrogenase